ncbi:MAG TPA: sensor histidine kinase [Streptosporangiaceae bacterium]
MTWLPVAWRRYLQSPVRDAVFAVGWGAVLIAGSYGEMHPNNPSDIQQFRGHHVPHSNTALLLVAVACAALAWRRRYPVPVLMVSLSAVVAYSLLGYVNGAALLAPAIALFFVTSQVSVRLALAWAFVTLTALLTATAANNPFGHISGGGYDLIPALVAAGFFGGIAAANRRAYAASVAERAEQEARRRLDEERLRIARELHDVVAHTMATINVQAGTALHVLPTRPEAAPDALAAIKKASKDGLRELRAILNVLRQADEADPTAPAPGVRQLATLVAGACQAGLPTKLSVTGTPVPLPAPVDLAAYRIVQESLTNAIRHAGPATATVSLNYDADALRVEVADTGLGGSADVLEGASGGHGLAGMRERATTVGGTVEAGPVTGEPDGGGFRVTARLPVQIPSLDTRGAS